MPIRATSLSTAKRNPIERRTTNRRRLAWLIARLTLRRRLAWLIARLTLRRRLAWLVANVTVNNNSNDGGAVTYEAWDTGTFNFSVFDCILNNHTSIGSSQGIFLYTWRWGSTAPTINFNLKKTKFYNWYDGVHFDNQDPVNGGTTAVNTDCFFFSNVTNKVYDWGSDTEYCP